MIPQTHPAPARTALILSGGGASGAYEVGVMRALFAGQCPSTGFRKLQPGIFAGTSVGAVNASLILSSPARDLQDSVTALHHIYLNEIAASSSGGTTGLLRIRANPLSLLHLADWPVFLRDVASLSGDIVRKAFHTVFSTRAMEERVINMVDLSLLVDTNALRRLISRYLNPLRIARSGRILRIIATNWKDGTVKVFRGEDLGAGAAAVEIVLASAALPGIFSQVPVGGTPYADGGIVMNSALKPAIDAGADEIHLVYVDPAVDDIPVNASAGTVEIFVRALTIALASMLNRDIEAARRVNLGLEIIHNPGRIAAAPPEARKATVRTVAGIQQHGLPDAPYRPIMIHRYRPDQFTEGTVQWLDFARGRIAQMIEAGYVDTLRHDCSRQGCIVT